MVDNGGAFSGFYGNVNMWSMKFILNNNDSIDTAWTRSLNLYEKITECMFIIIFVPTKKENMND